MNRAGTILLALALLPLGCRESRPVAREVQAPPASQDERMEWWREARFGMFIHWGLYAIPAGEWPMGAKDARHDYGEWIRDSAQIPVGEYDRLQPRFDPVKFDADLWARTAAAAGMKYLVITSKHHDGFGLFDSKETTWDVLGTPFRRDILAELSAACARHGVRFCTYHSIMDWHHPDYLPRRGWEKAARPEDGADFDRFERYLHAQVEEVATKYHPGVMWFDGEWESTWNHERGLRLYDLCRRLDPWMIVNNRVDVHRGGMGGFSGSDEAVGDFATPEQEIPATGMPGVDWETCMTMNDHWGFCAADANWKSVEDLVRKLADIASKGGNFLLNVGPRADGTFPPEAVDRLARIGAWMKTNGESIHGTSASLFDDLAFGRCTVRAGDDRSRIYLHVFDWPKERRIVLPGLGNEIGRAYLLARPGESLAAKREGPDAWIALPATMPDPIDTVVVLEVAGAPIVHRAPRIVADADVFVRPMAVRVEASSPDQEVRYTTDGKDPDASSARCEGPITIAETCTLKARAFLDGAPVSGVVAKKFEKVAPRASTVAAGSLPGIRCDRFAGEWDALPDFGALTATGAWNADEIGLPWAADAVPQERIGLWFRGFVDAPRDDVYVFELSSDDGSRLAIDGQVVVDNDGPHSATAKRGRIALAAGSHAIEVLWFNRTGGAQLSLGWAPLGSKIETVRTFRREPEEANR
jgi:alpha-L-fucosidase